MQLRSRRGFFTGGLLGAVALTATSCATNPVSGKKQLTLMSEAQEIAIGQQMDPEVQREYGVYDDRELQDYVSDVGLRLARQSERPRLPWTFTIVDSPAVNAFALPGGYIYVTRGILGYLNDEAELAGVLGHEIGHVTARHAVAQYSKSAGAGLGMMVASIFFPPVAPFMDIASQGVGLLFLKNSRGAEVQADALGARYAAENGWEPEGVADMLRALARISDVTDRRGVPSWLATHPEPASRVADVEPVIASIRASQTTPVTTGDATYLQRIDGLMFGENPREGVVRGSSFLHPELRFAIDFPDGWEIENGKEAVVARLPGEPAYVVLQLVDQPRGRTLDDVARQSMRSAGLRQQAGDLTRIGGLEAFVGTWRGKVSNIGDAVIRAAFIGSGRSVYRVAGLASAQQYDQWSSEMDASLRSFRALDARQASAIQPNHLTLYTVTARDTWQSIAQRQSGGSVRATTLAIMNGHDVNDQPEPGERIKIVVGS